MARYKWESAHDWLYWKVCSLENTNDARELATMFRMVLSSLDGDSLQDLFQDDMEEDGYFQDLDQPPVEEE
jgi:hypothetical protein